MLHIYYGKGKGKTSAALGLMLRAAGYKKRIILFQFLKPANVLSGEYASLKKFSCVKLVRFSQTHPIFMRKKGPRQIQGLKAELCSSIEQLRSVIKKGDFDILVCDELLNTIGKGWVSEDMLVRLFGPVKKDKEIILTGRIKPKKLCRIADYITECRLVKHPFDRGVLARKGIEY